MSLQGSERGLLAFLLAKLHDLDADVFTGHNISGFDMDVLLHRLQHLKASRHSGGTPSFSPRDLPVWVWWGGLWCAQIPLWSRIGRLKRVAFPSLTGGGGVFGGGASHGLMTVLAGRLLCDTYLAARELLKEVEYTMKGLARKYLGQERQDLSAADVPGRGLQAGFCAEIQPSRSLDPASCCAGMFESADKLKKLLACGESDAWLSLKLSFFLNVLPLSKQLSELSGSLWTRALQVQHPVLCQPLQ